MWLDTCDTTDATCTVGQPVMSYDEWAALHATCRWYFWTWASSPIHDAANAACAPCEADA